MGTTASSTAEVKPIDTLLLNTAKSMVPGGGVERRNSLLIRNNEVAPIIIKNCKEEYQHVNNFKEPITYASITDTSESHALILNKYFLIRDFFEEDFLGDTERDFAPNYRSCRDNRYPVYCTGQPSKNSLVKILQSLKQKGHNCILIFNLRIEPVIFIKEKDDYIPYCPGTSNCRISSNYASNQCWTVSSQNPEITKPITNEETDQQQLDEGNKATAADVTTLETNIRTEIINLAALRDKPEFYCYNPMKRTSPNYERKRNGSGASVTRDTSSSVHCRQDHIVEEEQEMSNVDESCSNNDEQVGCGEKETMECDFKCPTEELSNCSTSQKSENVNNVLVGNNDCGMKMFAAAYDDDMEVTEEVYSRMTFNNTSIRYVRVPLTEHATPTETDIDTVLQRFAEIPDFFTNSSNCLNPAILFTSRMGICRGTYGLILGCLLMAHKTGFPKHARASDFEVSTNSVVSSTDTPINEDNASVDEQKKHQHNFKIGDYLLIRRLVDYLNNGKLIKHQVDVLTDLTNELHDARHVAFECKQQLEQEDNIDYITDAESDKNLLLKNYIKHIQRYFYLICVNAYLHEQYKHLFAITFTQWINARPFILQLLTQTDISERTSNVSLITSGERALVADDYIGLDMLSSSSDVNVSNFRKFPSLNIFGMAQPTVKGVKGILKYFANGRLRYKAAIVINLREDLSIDCDDDAFGPREIDCLSRPINMPGITTKEIEIKEEQLRDEILHNKDYEVFLELDQERVFRSFTTVCTTKETFISMNKEQDEAKEESSKEGSTSTNIDLNYHRLPMSDDKAPTEKNFDDIMGLVVSAELKYQYDEDGPAIVFCCRSGKGRTTTAMVIAGLIICHIKGFPYGTRPGQEARVSIPNADLTNGNYKIVQTLVRRLPYGQQVKREVDFILDQCSDTMTPMHFHMREVILVTYNKAKKSKTEKKGLYKKSLDLLERYMYLIIFNSYLHCDRHNRWRRSFEQWMTDVAPNSGIYEILDNLTFNDEDVNFDFANRRNRWNFDNKQPLTFRGTLV